MIGRNNKTKEIALGDDFGDVAVSVNGVRVEIRTDGSVKFNPVANDEQRTAGGKAPKTGDLLPDGWIVGPVSPDTGEPIAIEPVSGALEGFKTWYQGESYAAELRGKGNANARQPSDSELNAIFNDVMKAGRNGNARLDTSDSSPYGIYWSGTTLPDYRDLAHFHFLGDGNRGAGCKAVACARVRCVRDEPGLTLA